MFMNYSTNDILYLTLVSSNTLCGYFTALSAAVKEIIMLNLEQIHRHNNISGV